MPQAKWELVCLTKTAKLYASRSRFVNLEKGTTIADSTSNSMNEKSTFSTTEDVTLHILPHLVHSKLRGRFSVII